MKRLFSKIMAVTMICTSCFVANPLPAQAEVSAKKSENFANLVVFAYFSDDSDGETYFKKKDVSDRIMKIFNGGHGRSLKNYVNKISYEKINLINVFPQYKNNVILAHKITRASLKDAKSSSVDDIIITEIMEKIGNVTEQLDYNGDQMIDNLTIVLKGSDSGQESSGSNTLYSHHALYMEANKKWANLKNLGISHFNIIPTDVTDPDKGITTREGVVAHEFLHTLGFPDLYTGGQDKPVYDWDIMGAASPYVQWPLAYIRKEFGQWITIDTITESKTKLTLSIQSNKNGKQAYILQSPLNDQEVFVVEYRKSPVKNSSIYVEENSLDARLGSEGIIVYRINKTVTGLSNYKDPGRYGAYVFRLQPGQPGYMSGDDINNIRKSALAVENQRTSIGSSDMSKGLSDGALTYENEKNSGIVISNVSSNQGDTITFDVTIPKAGSLDLWKDSGLEKVEKKDVINTAMVDYKGNPYLMVCTGNDSSTFRLYKLEGENWVSYGESFTSKSIYGSTMQLFDYNGSIYAAYAEYSNTVNLKLKKFDSSSKKWSDAASISNAGNKFDVKVIGGKIYAAYIKDSKTPVLSRLDGNSFATVKEGYNTKNDLIADPILADVNGQVYTSFRSIEFSNPEIRLFKYDEKTKTCQQISADGIASNTYDMTSVNGILYIAARDANNNLQIHSYDGAKWTKSNGSNIKFFSPKFAITKKDVYIAAEPDSTTGGGSTIAYRYNLQDKNLIKEGEEIDGKSNLISTVISNGKMFVGYVKELSKALTVKYKTLPAEGGAVKQIQPTIENIADQTYTGSKITPKVVVKDGNRILTQGIDYDVTYGNNINIGEGSVTVTLKGSFRGTATKTFQIVKKTINTEGSGTTDTEGSGTTDTEKTGVDDEKAVESVQVLVDKLPESIVTLDDEPAVLAARKAYDALSPSAKQMSSASALLEKITEIEAKINVLKQLRTDTPTDFKDSERTNEIPSTEMPNTEMPNPGIPETKMPVRISLKSVKQTKGKRRVTVQWKGEEVDGYEVYMKAGKEKFKKVKTIKNGKKTKYDVAKGLKVGKKYTFKVRGFMKINEKTVYGAYSKTKKLVIKK